MSAIESTAPRGELLPKWVICTAWRRIRSAKVQVSITVGVSPSLPRGCFACHCTSPKGLSDWALRSISAHMRVLVTGGCGFIGSNLVKYLRRTRPEWTVVNLDKLTYAGNLETLADLEQDPRHLFVRGDISDRVLVEQLIHKHSIDAVMHLAAESHVDRSILGPEIFTQTNVVGTQVLLDAASRAKVKRFVMVSTDEVYGSLGPTGSFSETSPLAPSSPYSASKAGADLFALAYHHTFGLDVGVTRCSNNYGRYQFPEKLIPLMIVNAFLNQPLPLYVDWL